MRSERLLILWLAIVSAGFIAQAQGTFQNLGFESANVSGYPPGGIPATNAIPGWTAYLGQFQSTQMLYNTVSLGSPAISIHDAASSYLPILGNYSVILQSTPGGPSLTSSVGQIGQIPSSAMSLIFYGSSLQVSFNGQPLAITQLGSSPAYSILGADISAFGGQTGELKFSLPNFSFGAMSYLDNIQFSNQPIPEPSVLGLLALGALLLGLRFIKAQIKKGSLGRG